MLYITMNKHVIQPPLILLFIGTLSFMGPASADVYKWVDDQGRVHYGDRPPEPNTEPLPLQPATVPAQPAPSEDARRKSRQRLLDVYWEERQQKQADAQRQRRQKAERQEKCQQTQRRYARFNGAGGIYQKNTKGSREYLERDERERFMQELKAEVERRCGRN